MKAIEHTTTLEVEEQNESNGAYYNNLEVEEQKERNTDRTVHLERVNPLLCFA
jgi:hypothetical protein